MAGLFNTIKSALTGSGLEVAPYQVVRIGQGYEERVYPARKWVQTSTTSMSKDSVSSTLFFRLFNYISGQNSEQVKIDMTAPVSIFIEPGAGPNCESMFTMAFYVPSRFQDSPPAPTDASVAIELRPELKVFARTYPGFDNEKRRKEELASLISSLTEQDRKCVDPDEPYYYAGYDPPFKLFFRRNDIWILLKDSISDEAQNEAQTNQCEQLVTTDIE